MKLLTIIFLLSSSIVFAQDHDIAHFSVWNPKQATNFQNGYKQHLLWHKANKDTWSWYGWYIISGPRDGQFIDATFGHSWADFDNPVNPAGDEANNELHTEPFADFLRSYKVALMPFSDKPDQQFIASKMLRMLTVDVSDINQAAKIVEQRALTNKFVVFDVVDGGSVQQLIILIPVSNNAGMLHMQEIQNSLQGKGNIITGITAETLLFQPEMSTN